MLKLSVSIKKLVRVIKMTKILLFRLFVARQAHFQPFFLQPVQNFQQYFLGADFLETVVPVRL